MAEDAQPPKLTMPEAESAAVLAAYQSAEVILEYGTGGSTVLAADLPGRRVFSVESSADWLAMMQDWFSAQPPKAQLVLHHANIGPTRKWGYPASTDRVDRWSLYPISVWDRPDFRHPDVVLIDGRFRLACALTVLFRITRDVTVLIDDYLDRPAYNQIETLVGRPEMNGRLARFTFTPQPVPVAHLGWIMTAFASPQ